MELFFWILVAGGVILNIWLIYLFVSMASDVKSIRTRLDGPNEPFSHKELKLAIIQGKQEEAYQAVITRMYNILYDLTESDGNSKYIEQTANSRIELATRMCKELGRDLPEQLQSFDSFKQFVGSNNN